MKFLITRPDHDDTVFYLHEFSKELIEIAKDKGFKVLDCDRKKANRKTVQQMIQEQKPELIMFNGHGNPPTICGHKNEALIKQGENEEILEEKIVYARSCSTASSLGPSAVKKGAKTFIGYTEDFVFLIDNSRTANPLKDEFAKPFLTASNQIIKSLLNGRTALEAHQRSQKVFDEQIESLQKSDAPPEAQHLLPWLFWDKTIQTILGEKNAQI